MEQEIDSLTSKDNEPSQEDGKQVDPEGTVDKIDIIPNEAIHSKTVCADVDTDSRTISTLENEVDKDISSQVLPVDGSSTENTLCMEPMETSVKVSSTSIDDLSQGEKSKTSGNQEPLISTETRVALDLPNEIAEKPTEQNEGTVGDKVLDETISDNTIQELSTEDDTSKSPQSKIPDAENISDMVDCLESETKKLTEDAKSDSEVMNVETDSHSKEITLEKQIGEPENTEFVQITQDKQDDTQNEGQTIEAEDPFGADNLIPDNIEQITNVDSPTTVDMNFRKLGDQAVNLQDVVNAKDSKYKNQTSGEFATEDSNLEDASEMSIDNVDNQETRDEIATLDVPERNVDSAASVDVSQSKSKSSTCAKSNEKNLVEKSTSESMIVDSTNEATDDDSKKKNDNEEQTMETDESQSNVLPGQDDELCIIPDSMKESATPRVAAVDDTDKVQAEVDTEKTVDKDDETEKMQSKESETTADNDDEAPKETTSWDKEQENPEKPMPEKTCVSSTTTDVIDIDEELKSSEIDEIPSNEICKQCNERKPCNISVKVGPESYTVCSQSCKTSFMSENDKSMDIPSDGVKSKREKRCASCLLIVETGDERNLSWETMEFCNEECLNKFQTKYGSYCRNCNGSVQPISLGKYCVRFGYDVRQFCCSSCLEEFKKGLKVCSYCQKDISSGTEGFLAPVGDKGQFKDFCTQYCMEKYSRMNSTEPPSAEKKSCSVCQEEKIVHCEVQIDRASPVAICSDPCFAAFKFVNKVDPEQCSTCKKFFELASKKSFVVFYEGEAHTFCNKTCLNIFIITNRKIVPCNWCKVKKYNFDMIRKDLKTGQALMMCSLNCLTLYQVSVNAVSAKRISCDFCKEFSQAQYHLTMSDATIRNFCSYNCVMKFQSQYTKSPITIPSSDDPVPTGMPKRTYPPAKGAFAPGSIQTVQAVPIQKPTEIAGKKAMPVISSVTSLASLTSNGQVTQAAQQSTINSANVATASVATTQSPAPQVIVNHQVITRPPSPPKIHNKITQCKPLMHTKGVSVRPHPCPKGTQTEGEARVLIPIPVPIYVPFPVHMWSMPFPVPVPFPLPIPVPIFIPTTRNSAKGIFKDIKRIQEKIPADPFEAELLMMAEMVATEKKANDTDSDSSDDNGADAAEPVDSSNTFGEDMLQMALKMATGELDEPAVDLETALTPNTITATQTPSQTESSMETDIQPERNVTTSTRGKKRMVPYKPRGGPSKRGRRASGVHDVPMMPPPEPQPPPQPRMMEPIEKPDANMALKYTFGVNAWRQWVIAKNAELEKQVTPPRKVKLFKTDLLQLTADELNYTLCLFVKEVRKPNGAEYAPDTIYYLCLGIQQYLFENNRIDNIFTDSYYEKFTDCLNEVAKKFSVLYNDAQFIVTRVEEEHLWECKQLGAHSPHVLLSTLMFFNTKHFNLVTVEEHMQLSFSHIMKHWKRNPAAQAAAVAGKAPSTRNVLLRFYPPQSALEANSRKKKVYEQQENEENPLRCPVKLYEFYLSKCPESVKTRNDVFYLLPERSCVPDSPVWYSTSALAKEHLVKMLYRVKMVKEINVALLTS